MNSFDKSLDEMHKKQDRQITALNKSLRITKCSLIRFLATCALFIPILPFATSDNQLIALLGIFSLAFMQFAINIFRR